MGTTVSRPEPRRAYIESEIDDEDDEDEEFEDEEEFDPSQWINESSMITNADAEIAATAEAVASSTMPTTNVAAVATNLESKLARRKECRKIKQHHENSSKRDESRPSKSQSDANAGRSKPETDSIPNTTTAQRTPFPNRAFTLRIIVNHVSEGYLPFVLQGHDNLLGRQPDTVRSMTTSTNTRKRSRSVAGVKRSRSKKQSSNIRVVTPTKKVEGIQRHQNMKTTTNVVTPKTIVSYSVNATKPKRTKVDVGDDKKLPARVVSNQFIETKIDYNRWSKEDDEPLLETIQKSTERRTKWDDEDEEPIVKDGKSSFSRKEEHMQVRNSRQGSKAWANSDLEPLHKNHDKQSFVSKESTAPNDVKSMTAGSNPILSRRSRVKSLQRRTKDEETIMKVFASDIDEAQLDSDAFTAFTSDDDSETTDDFETTARDDEEFYEQSGLKRPRLRSKQNNNIAEHGTNGFGSLAGNPGSSGAKLPQLDKIAELLGDKTWETDERGRTIWTGDRDETLCIAVALQSQKEAADWEEIRRAVGASSICSVQHRWVRVKYKKPTEGLLRVIKELSIPSWPIELRDKWTKAEIKILYELVESLAGLHYEDRWTEISRRLGRTVNAVQAKFTRMNKKIAMQKEKKKSRAKTNVLNFSEKI